jgi:hypothetical protein
LLTGLPLDVLGRTSTQVVHKNGKLCKKNFEANSTQCSQAVTHPSTD